MKLRNLIFIFLAATVALALVSRLPDASLLGQDRDTSKARAEIRSAEEKLRKLDQSYQDWDRKLSDNAKAQEQAQGNRLEKLKGEGRKISAQVNKLADEIRDKKLFIDAKWAELRSEVQDMVRKLIEDAAAKAANNAVGAKDALQQAKRGARDWTDAIKRWHPYQHKETAKLATPNAMQTSAAKSELRTLKDGLELLGKESSRVDAEIKSLKEMMARDIDSGEWKSVKEHLESVLKLLTPRKEELRKTIKSYEKRRAKLEKFIK